MNGQRKVANIAIAHSKNFVLELEDQTGFQTYPVAICFSLDYKGFVEGSITSFCNLLTEIYLKLLMHPVNNN